MNALERFMESARNEVGIEKEYAPPMNVERGAIRRYVEAIEDPNRLYAEEEYAKSRRFPGVVAPPLFLCGFPPTELLPTIPDGLTGLHGGDEWEVFRPVVAGDVITRRGRLIDVKERVGRTGRMVFLTMEMSFTNRSGTLVATYRATIILRPKPGAE